MNTLKNIFIEDTACDGDSEQPFDGENDIEDIASDVNQEIDPELEKIFSEGSSQHLVGMDEIPPDTDDEIPPAFDEFVETDNITNN